MNRLEQWWHKRVKRKGTVDFVDFLLAFAISWEVWVIGAGLVVTVLMMWTPFLG